MMARLNQSDPIPSFMDGVQVKIAEAYKPPRKLTLPAVYNNNNKFPDATKYNYDFNLEHSVLDKLNEWRKVRQANNEARRIRIEERKKKDEGEKKLNDSPTSPSDIPLPLPTRQALPLQTTILTPQPLSPVAGDLHDIDLNVKTNGLDYSDFDNDTSSPFDNMELKTIDDMEELAQVLQSTSTWIPPARFESILKELTLSENEANEEINMTPKKVDPSEDRNDLNVQQDSNRRNISIIVEELQRELDRPHMENWKPWPDLESPECDTDPNSNRLNVNRPTLTDSILLNPIIPNLTEENKKLVKHLNDMGFPTSRATRAISKLGEEDNKKVIEYLLAVQYLEELGISGDDAEKALSLNNYDQAKAKKYHENLCTLKDLGFSEEEASRALLKCDIDRDKALDLLFA